MGNPSNSKNVSIPSWQMKPLESDPATSATEATSGSQQESEPATQTALLEHASKFLDDESIRDAPREKKVAFLEKKGLQGYEIQKLLGDSESPKEDDQGSSSDMKTLHATSDTSTPPSSSSATTASASTSIPRQNRDVPPVITYPEFLLRPEKPPPLITAQRLLYTLYGAASLSAILYGTSKYLVTPMLENLTSTRHDLFTSTSERLDVLNAKLEANVSRVPPPSHASNPSHHTQANDGGDDDEAESIDSDPTELFHRDIATQTSPQLSRSASSTDTATTASAESTFSTAEKVVTSHTKRLTVISSHMSEFLEQEKASLESDSTVQDRVSELQTYLDTLTYSNLGAGAGSYMNVNYNGGYGMDDLSGNVGKGKDGEDDAITKFKQEIRSVKGALLSARNFPGSAAGRIPGR